MTSRLSDKVVVVTGAGSGIGASTARRFLQEGAFVVLNGRREDKLRETASGSDPASSLIHPGDVSDEEYVQRLIGDAVSRFKKLDVLVNNAGIAAFGPSVDMEKPKPYSLSPKHGSLDPILTLQAVEEARRLLPPLPRVEECEQVWRALWSTSERGESALNHIKGTEPDGSRIWGISIVPKIGN